MGFSGPRVIPTIIKRFRGLGIFRKLNRIGGGWRFRPTLPRLWPTASSSGYTPPLRWLRRGLLRDLGMALNNCWRSIS